jgi:hypothetical protein
LDQQQQQQQRGIRTALAAGIGLRLIGVLALLVITSNE